MFSFFVDHDFRLDVYHNHGLHIRPISRREVLRQTQIVQRHRTRFVRDNQPLHMDFNAILDHGRSLHVGLRYTEFYIKYITRSFDVEYYLILSTRF